MNLLTLIKAAGVALLLPAVAMASPSLLIKDEGASASRMAAASADAKDTAFYLPDYQLMRLLLQGDVEWLTLPAMGREIEFRRTDQTVREKNVTWSGVDAAGLVKVLLTLDQEHIYGQITGDFGTVSVAPDAASERVGVKLLAPAYEMAFKDDALVPPQRQEAAGQGQEEAAAEDGSRIDVMVLYTNGMAAAHPGSQIGTRIQYLIDQGNLAFSNSAAGTRFHLVYSQEVNYPDTSTGGMSEALDAVTNNAGVFANIEALRTAYGADQVVLLRRYVSEGCGLAWVLKGSASDARNAYAVVHDGAKTDGSGYYCSDLTYVHEIGHNLGCAHDRANAGVAGKYPYSYGYQSPAGTFRTVMGYNCPNGCPRIPYFSNPDISYNGEPTGVLHTAANAADNARTISQTRVDMANYRPSVVTTSYTVTPSAGSGGSISPNTAQTVNHGATVSFTVTPNAGYTASVGGTCGGSLNGTAYTTSPVTANCTVTASFTPNSHPLSVSKTGSGTVTSSPAGISCGSTCSTEFPSGQSVTLTANPAAGYTFTGWGGACSGIGTCTVSMTQARSVTAAFVLNSYTVTPSAGVGGSISPNTAQAVNHGATVSFTVTPNTGYSINTVSGCGGSLNTAVYTTAPVTADCTVTADFVLQNDTDNDGIDDGWELQHFGNLTTADATSDFDKDGYSDRQEYLNWLAGEKDPQGAAYDPKVKNAPGGTGYAGGASFLPAVKLLLRR